MAINAYVGTPGSGKTYEVVRSVILPAFLNGRRIVTNIEGISQENFLDYVDKLNNKRKENNKIDYACLGSIVKVNDDDCLKPNFFPYKNCKDETIAKNGDLICIDEVWRIFDDKAKIHENHRSFIAEHRHFVNDKGQTSDLVVINQSISNVPRFIKDRIETTFKMVKHISIGLSNRYRIDVYQGVKLFKSNKIHSIQAKYDSDIFSLYKSYDGNGSEKVIDNRVNFLKSPSFIIRMLLSLFLILSSSLYFYVSYFGKQEEVSENGKLHNTESSQNHINYNDIVPIKRETNNYINNQSSTDKGLSQKWRIIGYLKQDHNNLVILTDDKVIRYEYLSNFENEGNLLIGHIDGYRVTFYSGQTIKREKSEEIKKWIE